MGSGYPQNPTQNSLTAFLPPPSHLALPTPDLALLKLVRYKAWFLRSFVKGVEGGGGGGKTVPRPCIRIIW